MRSTASSTSPSWRTDDTATSTSACQRRTEVGARRVQPRQHRAADAVATQRERLVDGGHAEFGRAGGQGGAPDRHRAVAVPVGLDDGHHLGRPGVLTQQPHVVGDRVEVHHGLGGRGGGQRKLSRLHGHVTTADCPRTAS